MVGRRIAARIVDVVPVNAGQSEESRGRAFIVKRRRRQPQIPRDECRRRAVSRIMDGKNRKVSTTIGGPEELPGSAARMGGLLHREELAGVLDPSSRGGIVEATPAEVGLPVRAVCRRERRE